jgi:serine/threonine protein kinase
MFLPPDDDLLAGLEGVVVRTAIQPEVEYRLERVIGAGSYAVAFYSIRSSPDGQEPVVLKIIRPSLIRAAGEWARLAVEKETVALGRLNERVPATPFVVRLLASDAIEVEQGGLEIKLPWLALEYVHGGAEGTTLEERIDFSVEQTGYAFEPDRAALALTCLASGLHAIHEVGVVHRDLSPHNVLCCGFGNDELFKIADFGIARDPDASGTFVGAPGGTPGYTAPEQVRHGEKAIGPESDVFSLAAVAFKLLTGEELFLAKNAVDGALLAVEPDRRSIRSCKALYPDLAERIGACDSIDRIIRRGTAADPRQRPPTGWDLCDGLLRALRSSTRRSRPSRRRLESITEHSVVMRFGWGWHVRQSPGQNRGIRSVAWDTDGRCLAATTRGLLFWTGSRWVEAPVEGLPYTHGIRFVERVGPGAWVIGGDGATIAHYSSDGLSGILRAEDPSISFTHASGDLEDLAVLVGERSEDPPLVFGLAARRWMKPASLSRARIVTGVARLEDDRWLLCGVSTKNEGFVASYSPLMFDVERIASHETGAFTACAAHPDLGMGMVVGRGGRALKIVGQETNELKVPGAPDLDSVAIDVAGRVWATSPGRIYLHEPEATLPWKCVWRSDEWTAPFVGLFADVGRIVATTKDGAVIEGRWQRSEERAPIG